ncbi:TPA: DUF4123 domain-containing protein [Photobacterium damselae]
MLDPQTLNQYGVNLSAQIIHKANHTYHYAIIEPTRCESLDKWRYGLLAEPPRRESLFDSTIYQAIPDGPVLLDLTAANEEFLACLYQQAEVVPLGCFFSSEANFDECLTLLRGRITAKTSQASALFRFFEPRGLLALISALSEDEKRALFYKTVTLSWFHHEWLTAHIPQQEDIHFQDLKTYQWVLTENKMNKMEETLLMQSHHGGCSK